MPTLPPVEPERSASGIVLDPSTLERVVPATRRADGSLRKELRIRPGYTPQEDVGLFRPRRQQALEALSGGGAGGLPKGHIPGWGGPRGSAVVPGSGRAGAGTGAGAAGGAGAGAGGAGAGEAKSRAAKKNEKRKEKKKEQKEALPVRDAWDEDEDGSSTGAGAGAKESVTPPATTVKVKKAEKAAKAGDAEVDELAEELEKKAKV